MAQYTVGDLVVKMDLDAQQMASGTKKVENDIKGLGSELNKVGSAAGGAGEQLTGLANAAKSLGGEMGGVSSAASNASNGIKLLIAGGVVTGLIAVAKAAKEWADGLDQIGRQSRLAQMDVEQFQRVQKALFISGGLSADAFAKAVDELASNLNEAARKENDLSKWLDANNIKWKERGKVIIDTNQSIEILSQLLKKTRDVQDKVDLAKAFGFPKEALASLERGPEVIREYITQIEKAGGVTSREVIAKAEEFSRAWRFHLEIVLTHMSSWAMDASKIVASVFSDAVDDPELKKDVEAFKKVFDQAKREFKGETISKEDADKVKQEFWDRLKNAGTSVLRDLADLWKQVSGTTDIAIGKVDEYALAIEAANQAAKKAAEQKGTPLSGPVPMPPVKPFGDETKRPPEEEKEKESLNRRFRALQQALADESEAMIIHRENQLKDLDFFIKKSIGKEEEHEIMKEQIKEKFQEKVSEAFFQRFAKDNMTELELLQYQNEEKLKKLQEFENAHTHLVGWATEERKKINDKYNRDQLLLYTGAYAKLAGIVDQGMGAISKMIGDESKKGFTITKAVSTATAIVKGIEAVVSAHAAGAKTGIPGMGEAMAAATAVAVAAQIAAMHAVTPEGGGGVPAPAGGGGAAAAGAAAADPGSNKTLSISGFNHPFYTRDQVRFFVQQIEEFTRDGGRVVFKSPSQTSLT